MTGFIIRTVNSSFETEIKLRDETDADVALTYGVRGGVMIAGDEIYAGKDAVTVEIIIEDSDGVAIRRSAVTITVAPLIPKSLR